MPRTSSGMFYRELGRGDRTLVMLPGFGCSTGTMTGLAERLPRFRVLIFDLPGHSESRGVPANGRIPSLAATVHDAIAEVVDGRYDLLGVSLGGAVALRIALDHPDRVRALVGVTPWNAAGTVPGDAVIAGFAASYGEADLLRQGVAAISIDPARTASLADDMLAVSREMWQGWLTEGVFTSQADELPGLRVPTCSLIGGKDVVVDQAKQLDDIRRVPSGRAVVLSDHGHLGVLEAPGDFARETAAFLGTVEL
ncbi:MULTISPECIES: alpha/beta fold hydrolase [Actinomadura]|uniref:Alpha/beta fold hydrolase n=1 Tax=Actinomadura yumaensis TaxID=111807 RepID=A0ABW2CKH5_9ACTN|nr:alpha/beta hydrolase [Actinomadura sp. J1-007]